MNNTKQWFAVYTRSRWEKKAADLLSRKQVEAYCPLTRVTRQWADRKKIVHEPLFTSYVFVHVTLQEQLAVKQTSGILNFVNWLGKPAVIKDEEIEAIKNFLNDYDNVRLERAEVNVNDRVRITHGPLIYEVGSVVEVYRKTVKVYLPTLGYNMIAEIDRTNIEVLRDAIPVSP